MPPFPSHPIAIAHILGGKEFPLRRVFCVGRNYAAHAREMGSSGREDPFFFHKPNDAVIAARDFNEVLRVPYPTQTKNFHHEAEFVLALGAGGRDIAKPEDCIYGYALGLDLTRRDLQHAAKDKGQPWDMAKAFDFSAPISPIIPKEKFGALDNVEMTLSVGGQARQKALLSDMIWNPFEIITHLSAFVELKAGDLIFTGTPEGVGPLQRGDKIAAQCGALFLNVEIF